MLERMCACWTGWRVRVGKLWAAGFCVVTPAHAFEKARHKVRIGKTGTCTGSSLLDAAFCGLRRVGFVQTLVKVNGTDVMVMMDSGATHSFVIGREVRKLKLDLKENDYRIKAVNSEAQLVLSLATVELIFGPWVGQCNQTAVTLDDFDLILKKELMTTNKIILVPHLNGVMVADERCPTFLPTFTIAANKARDSLTLAQHRMKKYADLGKRDMEFQVVDLDGPFEVIKRVGKVAYRLKLPHRLKVHSTFHVSFLMKYNKDELDEGRRPTKSAPPVIRKQFEKDVQAVLDH
ncbi:hypothetical protein ACH5RR_041447 [Cinchona calisaya]|uniref:Tf2-1-like SH3-like domain-containing protein n=1 Tax=Cinchona calisaya TaxID=153742 RepID=A0ABD2XZ08_9GENT